MAVALFAALRGAEVTLLDGREDRLAFCAEASLMESQETRRQQDEAAAPSKALVPPQYVSPETEATCNDESVAQPVVHGQLKPTNQPIPSPTESTSANSPPDLGRAAHSIRKSSYA